MKKPLVGIVMGSDSDYPVMVEVAKVLTEFDIPFDMTVASAHRSPERTSQIVRKAEERGIRVLIAGAGAAAHLAGVVAAESVLPVIGVPIDSTSLGGLDALLSTVQMPGGIPVATVAVGKAGAKNAGLLAVQILATSNEPLREKLREYKKSMAAGVETKAFALKKRLVQDGFQPAE
jgi:5-(carboxyamino)imidazole ribonucleotide mutase